jgi:hypothetical protein
MVFPYEVVFIDRFKTIDWNLQVERIRSVWQKYPCLRMRVDSTGIGDPIIQDLENKGVRVEPYVIKEVSKRQYIDKLSIFINDGRVIYPKNQDLINELDTYGREISEAGRVIYKPLGKFKEDCVSSFALACWDLPERARRIKKDEDDKNKKISPISQITGY